MYDTTIMRCKDIEYFVEKRKFTAVTRLIYLLSIYLSNKLHMDRSLSMIVCNYMSSIILSGLPLAIERLAYDVFEFASARYYTKLKIAEAMAYN